jgi:membrane protease YdiL (CAAX protease family)
VPPGTPYHRLGRTAGHRWWHPLTGTAVLLVAALALAVLVAAVLAATGLDPADTGALSPLRALAVFAGTLLGIAALVPAVQIAARSVRRRPGTVGSVAGRLRIRWLAWCALLAVVPTAVQLGGVLLLAPDGGEDVGGGWVGLPTLLLSVLVLLPLVPLQAAGEEYLARGWFVQALGSWLRTPWPGIVVGGAVWTALHVPSTWYGAADLMLFSLVVGWLTIRTGGLEAAVALHAVGNLAISFLLAAVGGLAEEGSAGDADWTLLAADSIALPLYAVAVVALHRRHRMSLVS